MRRVGVEQGAALDSVGANSAHGLRRNNADKQRAVNKLLSDAEWAQWSNPEIGRKTNTSHTFVAKMREAIESLTCNVAGEKPKPKQRTYRTKHGTVATMKIPAKEKPAEKPEPMAQDELDKYLQGAFAVEFARVIIINYVQ